MRTTGRALAARVTLRLLLALTAVMTSLATFHPFVAVPAAAQDDLRDPREIIITAEEAGKEATIAADEEGTDEFGRWAHRRWLRDRDNEDVRVGPIITDSKVWVTRDVETAKKLFRREADKNVEFPEREDYARSPFPFKVEVGQKPEELADEAEALSACIDCDTKSGINLHQRVTIRKGATVATVYIFGRETVATPELAVWFVRKLSERM